MSRVVLSDADSIGWEGWFLRAGWAVLIGFAVLAGVGAVWVAIQNGPQQLPLVVVAFWMLALPAGACALLLGAVGLGGRARTARPLGAVQFGPLVLGAALTVLGASYFVLIASGNAPML